MLVISYENQRDHAMPLTRRLNLKYMLTNFGREYVREDHFKRGTQVTVLLNITDEK